MKDGMKMQKPFHMIITDEDVFGNEKRIFESVSRYSSHGIVLCKDMESIAMVYNGRGGCYTLPGGGLETGETSEEAFIREIEEETGLVCGDISYLGYTEEHKAQTSYFLYCNWFLAKEIGRGNVRFTENEVSKRLTYMKVPISEVKQHLQNSFDHCKEYRRKFIQYRDLRVWEYYMKNFMAKPNRK